jgi:hypothetical protein
VPDDRGVSEVISFVLVFSLIAATVGVVFVAGTSQLTETRDAEQLINAERAFDVMADNIGDITSENAPNRATELKLSGARLVLSDPVTWNVSVEDNAGGTAFDTSEIYPIEYVAESAPKTAIVYTNGAVMRTERDGSSMKSTPNFVFGKSQTVLPMTVTRPPRGESPGATGGSSTVLVRTSRAAQLVELANTTDSPQTVIINVTAPEPRDDAWERYLEDRIDSNGMNTRADTCQRPVSGHLVCEFETDQLYKTETRIDTAFG